MMSTKSSLRTRSRAGGKPAGRRPTRGRDGHEKRTGSGRETIESVVIAFVLAFLFRTFEAEAFVIPTGSMAPTLMGRHKDVTCDQCGYKFTVGASETDPVPLNAVCPNCRFYNDIRDNPAFKGDRILVAKSLFELPKWTPDHLSDPRRWDVIVFKFPEEPQINYIKRVVGLSNEELWIHYGDIYVRRNGQRSFVIARKPPSKQMAMRQLVFDNDHQPRSWPLLGGRPRWRPQQANGWQELDGGRTFRFAPRSASDAGWARLLYHHLGQVWDGQSENLEAMRPQLVTDFYGYNSAIDQQQSPHWVGDLMLSLRAEVAGERGKLRLELVEAGELFVCQFDFSSGTCELWRGPADGQDRALQPLARAHQVVTAPGTHRFCFSNFDNRLTVWVDGKPVPFGEHPYLDYDGPGVGQSRLPTAADLRPARIAVQDVSVELRHIELFRDIYYTHGASDWDSEYGENLTYHEWRELLSSPQHWQGVLDQARSLRFEALGPDEFLVLGDNSPRSKDGRLWDQGARKWLAQIAMDRRVDPMDLEQQIASKPGGEVVKARRFVVRRQLLIGRAFVVYWPHGVPFGPRWMQFDISLGRLGTYRVPFYPHFSRMRLVR